VHNKFELANQVIARGKPVKVGWCSEGTPDSGPSGGTLVGYKLGRVAVLLTRNGCVTMSAGWRRGASRRRLNCWRFWESIYDSHGWFKRYETAQAVDIRNRLEVLRQGLYH
jgi:hypothetical protein